MSEILTCRGCRRQNHPIYARKYHGYCLECSNAGVPELRDELEALRAERADLTRQLADVTAERDKREKAARELISRFRMILEHKQISPAMNEGTQERFAGYCDKWLSNQPVEATDGL